MQGLPTEVQIAPWLTIQSFPKVRASLSPPVEC
jgi:hypothetical protein